MCRPLQRVLAEALAYGVHRLHQTNILFPATVEQMQLPCRCAQRAYAHTNQPHRPTLRPVRFEQRLRRAEDLSVLIGRLWGLCLAGQGCEVRPAQLEAYGRTGQTRLPQPLANLFRQAEKRPTELAFVPNITAKVVSADIDFGS